MGNKEPGSGEEFNILQVATDIMTQQALARPHDSLTVEAAAILAEKNKKAKLREAAQPQQTPSHPRIKSK